MGPLNEQALLRLGELASREANADLPPLPVVTEINLPLGKVARRTVVTGDGSGTQQICPAEPKRLAIILSALGATVTVDLQSPVVQDTGLILATQQTPVVFHKKDYGRFVTFQLFAHITMAINLYVLEILE